MSTFEAVIGLEVHAQMNTKSKMFCSCDNDAWGKPPNTTVCPVCMGHPGTLPVPNRAVIEKAIQVSKALKCTVNPGSHFDRKNYFYPDLPAGYQISQYQFPLASGGEVTFSISGPPKIGPSMSAEITPQKSHRRCGIHRLHIENDAGKLTHRGEKSLVDFNRAGTPLMEIVTEPDLTSADDAVAFAQELRRILIAADASDADMYKGMMRFDASISLRPKGEKNLYSRVEIKNLNSFKSLKAALSHQEKVLKEQWEKEGPPKSEVTVGWIDDEEKTVLLRDKESAADYRYFPEPDIPPLHFDQSFIDQLSASVARLPSEAREQYVSLGLTEAEATLLVDQTALQEIFDALYERTRDAKRASSLTLTQLLGFLKAHNKELNEGPSASALLELVSAIDAGTISANAGKEVLEEMVVSGKSALAIIEEKGMKQISDRGAIESLVEKAIAANPQAIESFKKGKTQALGTIVGWVMKESKGQANPAVVSELLRKKI